MEPGTLVAVFADFWQDNDNWITAALSMLLALLAAALVNRAFARRGRRVAQTVLRGDLTPEVDTRLRFVQRLVTAAIILLGVAIALSQFTGVSRLAASLLASGAIAAAVIGFAAQRTLGNVIAGVNLAISQPLRVGDWVTFEDAYGCVEDVRLSFTVLRRPGGQRVIIPNERLASGILRNDTLAENQVGVDVSIWLPAGSDVARAVDALGAEAAGAVTVAESTVDGVRLSVGSGSCAPPDRPAREAELRLRCLRRLHDEGLLARAAA